MMFYIFMGVLLFTTVVGIACLKNPSKIIFIGFPAVPLSFIALRWADYWFACGILGLAILVQMILYESPETIGIRSSVSNTK